jgi:protein involved in polysaccharide export with SLBB domain
VSQALIRCLIVGLLPLSLLSPAGLSAQIPQLPAGVSEAEALRLLRENPELVQQRLRQSGMTEAEIRALLRSRGLPADALDQFFDPTMRVDSTTAFSPDAVGALTEVGIFEETADGLRLVPVRTGMQQARQRADSLSRRVFGLDVFTRATSQFQPLLSGPVPDSYRVGPGDQMVLVLTGEVELAHQLEVTREGYVVIPSVGQVPVANLSMSDLRALLRTRLARSYSGVERGTTTFNVTVSRLRTNQIYVIGEVTQPGAYQLASVATVLNALYAAGGPTENGNFRGVQVRRRNGDLHILDLYPYLLAGDISGDVMLDQGDVVFVPLKGRQVQVAGAVVRPARFELAPTDGLLDVLAAAGGFAPQALRRRLTIHRVLRPVERGPGMADRQAVDLELRPAADSTAAGYLGGVLIPPVGLQDGDSVVVDIVPSLERGYFVTIGGEVMAPDTFPWIEGMTIRNLVDLSRGPTVSADLREAEVARMPGDRLSGVIAERLRVPLDSSYLSQRDGQGRFRGPAGLAFPPPGASPEFELEPFDQVTILPQPDFEMLRTAKVLGEVFVPGPYALLTTGDRVTDLVARSGGVLPTGYLDGARLFRTLDDHGRVDLDLVAALEDPTSDDNLLLQPGDSLFIPEYSPTVRVTGAVNSPVTVRYVAGEGLGYYIANAGGYRSDADEGRVSVRYANGGARTRSKFLFFSSYPSPGPGSEVLVPSRDPADRTDWIAILGPLVSAVGSVTALIIAVTR